MNKPNVIILDLDNCISDDRWRRSLIDMTQKGNDRYHRYHEHLRYDALGNAHLLKTPHAIVICTGRPERYYDITTFWLNKHDIVTEAILMRGDKDYRPAAVLKASMVQDYLLQTNRTIAHCYDDRMDVIEAYRTIGLKATQAALSFESVPVGL
jgi:hypothetical protein